ncbi:hypothetical protein MP638_004372 [Amoeboaphelidium occidentale]|nr:hypothetical protein MP638_004372 [Amoeboaphelidium occidentale]
MVVLASSICTKSGKAVVSRQYVEMSRSRIEGLLASFPKLISAGHQHTYIETDTVRYIYQPLEDLYMVLITNKQSNILQDNETLHLFARTVSEFCRSLKEAEIAEYSFELAMAFDEIISLGYRENINLTQLKTNTEMESQEEKLQEMLQKSKEREAIENAKLKAKQLEMQKREDKRRGITQGSGSSYSSLRSPPMPSSQPATSSAAPQTKAFNSSLDQQRNSVTAAPSIGKGLQLGGKPKVSDLLAAVNVEEGIRDIDLNSSLGASSVASNNASAANVASAAPTEGIAVTFEEKMSAEVNRDGGINNLEVKGDMFVQINDPSKSKVQFQLESWEDSALQFKTNPHVDKNNWQTSKIISTKDKNTAFPVNQSIPVLKWRYVTKDESMAPFSINFWPSVSGRGTVDCSVEYEILSEKLELQNVVLSIPLGSSSVVPKVNHVDGEYTVNPGTKSLEWKIPLMDASNSSGTLEFSIPGDNDSVLFPVLVSFTSSKPYIEIKVAAAISIESGQPVPFAQTGRLVTDEYKIV